MTRLKAQILLITTALLLPKLATAQGYTNVTADWSDIYTDVWDEAAPPVSCPSYVYIYSTINGYSGSGQASYPTTVNVAVHTPASDNITYTWTREIQDHGEQRGGNCGVMFDVFVSWPTHIAISQTNYKYVPQTACEYLSNCAPGTGSVCASTYPVLEVEPDSGYGCLPYYVDTSLVLTVNQKKYCSLVGTGYMYNAVTPYPCN